jgi:hypothetical protein
MYRSVFIPDILKFLFHLNDTRLTNSIIRLAVHFIARNMVPYKKGRIQWVPGPLSLGIKRPGREADHSPPSSAEVKNTWSYTSTPQYVLVAWCLVKHRGTFT